MRRRIILVLTVMALVLAIAMPAVAQESNKAESVELSTVSSGPSCNVNGEHIEDPEICKQKTEDALESLEYVRAILAALFG
jgi:hypothetical protein